jgi:hypothetical protein
VPAVIGENVYRMMVVSAGRKQPFGDLDGNVSKTLRFISKTTVELDLAGLE